MFAHVHHLNQKTSTDETPDETPTPSFRFLPIASISSINTIQGAFLRASANNSLTLFAPIPTNNSTKSLPDILIKGTFASPAAALTSKVLPVPGGPVKIAPYSLIIIRIQTFGNLAPNAVYFSLFFKKSMNSIISCFASSIPATSLNVTYD